jgi:hypothetical protein
MNAPVRLELQISLERVVNRGGQTAGGDHAKNPRWFDEKLWVDTFSSFRLNAE